MGCWKAVDKETLLVVLSCSDPKFLIVVTSEDYDELNESLSLASDKPSTILLPSTEEKIVTSGFPCESR